MGEGGRGVKKKVCVICVWMLLPSLVVVLMSDSSLPFCFAFCGTDLREVAVRRNIGHPTLSVSLEIAPARP